MAKQTVNEHQTLLSTTLDTMNSDSLFAHIGRLGDDLRRLDLTLDRLVIVAESWGVASPRAEAWWTLLRQKLLPQLAIRPLLVVAVMGGTNTGKSLLFNHLVGEEMSGVDPCAAGTKHPVCAVPASLVDATAAATTVAPSADEASLAAVLQHYFGAFRLVAWDASTDPLRRDADATLFWRPAVAVPERLLLLDTPDIDSDTPENWGRAEIVRQAADLILAVLTPEKYNDAATKRFFRETAAAKKEVILIFNRMRDDDLPHLASWAAQFQREAGVKPIRVLAVPDCRDRAATQTLPFFAPLDLKTDPLRVDLLASPTTIPRPRWAASVCLPEIQTGFGIQGDLKTQGDSSQAPSQAVIWGDPIDLRNELTHLHFDQIKVQTLRGALERLTDPENGLPRYLASIREQATLHRDARLLLLAVQDETTTAWPTLTPAALTAEVDRWWHARRPAWSQHIHAVYKTVGQTLRRLPSYFIGGETTRPTHPETAFRYAEEVAVSTVVERTMAHLESLRQNDNPVLRREVEQLLAGDFRERLVRESQAIHRELPQMSDAFRAYLTGELESWTAAHPDAVRRRETIDKAVAVARPLVTVALLVTGGVGAAYIVHETIISVVGATAGGAIGEAALYQTSERATTRFAQLFADALREWTRQRAQRFYDWFNERLWRDIVTRLDHGCQIAEDDAFLETQQILEMLTQSDFQSKPSPESLCAADAL